MVDQAQDPLGRGVVEPVLQLGRGGLVAELLAHPGAGLPGPQRGGAEDEVGDGVVLAHPDAGQGRIPVPAPGERALVVCDVTGPVGLRMAQELEFLEVVAGHLPSLAADGTPIPSAAAALRPYPGA